MRIDYTKIAEAERVLYEAKKKIRQIDTPIPVEVWEVMPELDKVAELLRAYLAEDNLLPDNEK